MTADPPIFRARSAGWGPTTRELLRDERRGHLTRVSHGRYVESSAWESLDELARHRVRTRAVASSAMTDNVYSHHAAAALWRIPLLGAWPMKVDVVGQRESGGRSSEQIRRRAGAHDMDISTVDGLRVTSPAQTAADLARILPRIEAVAAIDSVCWRGRSSPRTSLEDVRAVIERNSEDRGGHRATDAVAFATDLAESVWETASRVVIDELGFPRPVLQQPFRWSSSSTYRVDFWWPEQGIIGEFDGLVKYAPAAGADPREALIREKVREDRLRSMASGFVRWTASDVRDADRLLRLLSAAGLSRTPPSYAHANAVRA